MDATALRRQMVATAAGLYRGSGPAAYCFARGKLGGDPVFTALIARGLIPDRARVLDLGCGQGLLGAWLIAAERAWLSGARCGQWARPPATWSLRGIELRPGAVACLNRACGARAHGEVGDIRAAAFGEADVVVILDVLHYLDEPSQVAVLERARAALAPHGTLLLRIGDAGAGLRFRLSTWVDRLLVLLYGGGWQRLHCRPLRGWIDALERLGFAVDAVPMSANTPFANVLLVARPR
jgi:SAM-dependent methyltransferase